MGLFKLFRNDPDERAKRPIPWIRLENSGQLDEIESESTTRPVLIFKHSTRCGISAMALRRFEQNLDVDTHHIRLYYLDLLAYRALSDEVAARFQVWHQSPQIILIHKGITVHHASHHHIHPSVLNDFVEDS